MSDHLDDETRAWLRDLFQSSEPVPRDVVPGRGPDREFLLKLNAATDTWQEVTTPGEVTVDVNGWPTGVGPPTVEHVYCGGGAVTRSELAAAGLTADDVPNLYVIEDPTPRKDSTDDG